MKRRFAWLLAVLLMLALLCACGKMEIARVRRIAHQMDPHAMVMICDAAEVVGEGFTLPEDAN